MKIIYTALFYIPCFCSLAAAQFPANIKTFGSNTNDSGFDIVSTSDGGYAMTGASNGFTNGDYDFLLIKLDSSGNQQWARVYGGTANEQALQLVQTSDGGFAMVGKTTSFGAGDFDAMLVKADAAGNLQWIKSYGGLAEERLLNLRQTVDHGFILSGSTFSYGQGNYDMLFIRTDSVGDTLWTKILGGTGFDQGTDAEQTADGGFIFSGRVTPPGSALPDVCLVKTNSGGDTLWTRIFGSPGWDEAMKVKQTSDGGYIATGASTGFGNSLYDVYLTKTDSAGYISWSRRFSGNHNDATYDVLQLADGGYIVTGETESFGNNHRRTPVVQPDQVLGSEHSNVIVIRTDANGDTLWTRTYGGYRMDESFAILQKHDKGFVIAGYTQHFTTDTTDALLVCIDSLGNGVCYKTPAGPVVSIPAAVTMNSFLQLSAGLQVTNDSVVWPTPSVTQQDVCSLLISINSLTENENSTVFPNPADQYLVVSCLWIEKGKINSIAIYDAVLHEIFKSEIIDEKMIIDVSTWKSGVYLLQIGNTRKKFIKR